MNVILRNQVNESEYVVYSFTEDEKMMVQLKNYADDNVVRELYYDLSKVEQSKMYELDEYVIAVSRTDNGLELTLINFVHEVDYTDEDIELDVEYSEFDSDEWNILKEMVIGKEFNIYEENDISKQELKKANEKIEQLEAYMSQVKSDNEALITSTLEMMAEMTMS